MQEAIAYCGRRQHLRRSVTTAIIVGLVLTAINQGAVLLDGAATTTTYARCALNFMVPFVVTNVGLLGGRPRPSRTTRWDDELRR